MKKVNLILLFVLLVGAAVPTMPAYAAGSAAPLTAVTETAEKLANQYLELYTTASSSSMYPVGGLVFTKQPTDSGYVRYVFTLPEPKEAYTSIQIGFFGYEKTGSGPDMRVQNWTTAALDTYGFPDAPTTTIGEHIVTLTTPVITQYINEARQLRFDLFFDAADTTEISKVFIRYAYNRRPTDPTNPTPTNNAIDVKLDSLDRVLLSWQGGDDPDGPPVNYDVYVWSTLDPMPAVPTISTAGIKSALVGVFKNTDYFWKVVARDTTLPTLTNANTAVWRFKTQRICQHLILSHLGDGQDPVVSSPTNSTGCSAGYFYAGETVTLSARPDVGRVVDKWVDLTAGIDLSVPANSVVSVVVPSVAAPYEWRVQANYKRACYKVTVGHTGQGTDPVIGPPTTAPSGECGSTEFQYGDTVNFSGATPADSNWVVSGWSNTDDDGAKTATNILTMPSNHVNVLVNYTLKCVSVVTNYTGSGSAPTLSGGSGGCAAGKYKVGDTITATANPASGWKVGGWSGTNNNATTASSNAVTIPAVTTHTITVNYISSSSGTPATINGSVTLQGRAPAPNSGWITTLTVTLTLTGQSSPAYTFNNVPTDLNGRFILNGITPGKYDIRIKGIHTLRNRLLGYTLTNDANTVTFGTLLEGDANNDNTVGGADFSMLVASYNKCLGAGGFDSRSDFNGDNCVTGADFSLLATNYGKAGQP